MAGVTYRIEDEEVLGALAQLSRAADNPGQALHAIGAYGVFSTQRRFERETAPDGTPWRPLSPRTASRRKDGGAHILRQSLALHRSVNYDVDAQGVEWGSSVVYARIHQLGGVIEIPARSQRLTLKRIRRKGGGFVSRFAKANARGKTSERIVDIGAHRVSIPARPYLGIDQVDREEIVEIIHDHFRSEAGGRS